MQTTLTSATRLAGHRWRYSAFLTNVKLTSIQAGCRVWYTFKEARDHYDQVAHEGAATTKWTTKRIEETSIATGRSAFDKANNLGPSNTSYTAYLETAFTRMRDAVNYFLFRDEARLVLDELEAKVKAHQEAWRISRKARLARQVAYIKRKALKGAKAKRSKVKA